MASFADALDDMDAMIMSSLNDGSVDHLSAGGEVKASRLEAIVETSVERLSDIGIIDRVATITVRKALLGRYDRRGAFCSSPIDPVKALASKTWRIDGISSDDGDMITFYVVP